MTKTINSAAWWLRSATVLVMVCISMPGLAADIHIAVRAHAGVDRAMKKWGPTIDYLGQALPAHRFIMLPYTSLKKQKADARLNKFEFLLTNPSTYVELEVSSGAKAILTLINNRRGTAQTRFGSVIFTHVDNTDILKLEDLRGKDFMGVNPIGFGGWRVGLKVLRDHGIDPEKDFSSLQFPGKQPAVVRAVLDKKVHAGVVRTDMLERLADKGKVDLRRVRILNPQPTSDFPFFRSSPLYPEWPFAVMPQTDRQLAEQVKQTLLKLDKDHPAAKAGKYMGWTEALDYAAVKTLLAELGVEPFAHPGRLSAVPYIIGILLSLVIAFYFLRRYSKSKTD